MPPGTSRHAAPSEAETQSRPKSRPHRMKNPPHTQHPRHGPTADAARIVFQSTKTVSYRPGKRYLLCGLCLGICLLASLGGALA